MKKYKLILTLLVIVMSITSCDESFLERTPSDSISTATFFTQEKDLVFALNGVYNILGFNQWGWKNGRGTDMLRISVVTDDALDHHSWNPLYGIADGTAGASEGYVTGRWKERYKGIQRVNRILEGADGVIEIDEDLKNRILAEAKTLRAYFYFELTYLYGDVPFLTSSITPQELIPTINEDGSLTATEKAERTDVTVILDALVTELDAIASDLPLNYPSSDKGRVTRGTALFLKAKILLVQKKWTEAAQAAKDVMDLGAYSLNPSYKDLFTYAGIGNSEVILDVQVKQDIKRGEFYWLNFGANSAGGWSSGTPLQALVDTYELTDGLTIADSPLYDANKPYDNRDPRLAYSILYPGSDWLGGVYNTIPGATYPGKTIIKGDDLTDGTGGQWNKTASGYNWLKYISNKDITESQVWDGGVHYILMRYAEVLLMYAEAKIEAGSIDQSVYDAINEVRQRGDVNMPAITNGLSQSELRTLIRRERRVEFAFEGLRLLDIRRWDIAKDVMPGVPKGLTYDDNGTPKTLSWGTRIFDPAKDGLWPIPQSEVDVTGMKQNPGW
jgi:hypothetical protein